MSNLRPPAIVDPHVVSLRYALVVVDERHSYEEPQPVERDTDAFSMRLADGVVVFEMKEHFATESEARDVVERYLRAWEIDEGIRRGRPLIRFDFLDIEIIDRDPPSPESTKRVTGTAAMTIEVSGSLTVVSRNYPDPPVGFAVDADVETLWVRWAVHAAGRDSLQTTAHFCLTVLEMHGRRPGAAARFAIATKVLGTLARLSTERGDTETARKMTPKLRPLTDAEAAWLEAAVMAIIRRVGEVAANPNATRRQITMADLPQL